MARNRSGPSRLRLTVKSNTLYGWAASPRYGGLLPAGPYALLLLPLRSRARFQRHRVEGTTPGWPTIRPAVFNGYPRISGPSWPRDRSARHSRRLFLATARSQQPFTSRGARQARGPRTCSYFTVRTVRTVRRSRPDLAATESSVGRNAFRVRRPPAPGRKRTLKNRDSPGPESSCWPRKKGSFTGPLRGRSVRTAIQRLKTLPQRDRPGLGPLQTAPSFDEAGEGPLLAP